MRKLLVVALAVVALSLGCTVVSAKPKHAIVKALSAPVTVVKKAPVALKVTLGSIAFTAEAVVDVVHLGTAALDNGASMELKHNPFHAINIVVGKADSGLEKLEIYFFNVQNP